jgi:FkbM family methyltransferase
MRHATRHGYEFDLDLGDLVQWYFYWGFNDPSHDALERLCAPGFTVVDIGANIGITVLRAASAVGPTGRIIAVEPDPLNAVRLRANVARSGLRNTQVLETALGDAEGVVRIGVFDAHNRGCNRVETCSNQSTVDVPITTLDAISERDRTLKPDLLKLDVEGYETRVLIGSAKVLSTFHPVIFLEVADTLLQYQGSSAAELLSLLESQGYYAREAVDGAPVHSTDQLVGKSFDVVCTPLG